MAAIRATLRMLRLFCFCVCLKYVSCLRSTVGPMINSVRTQTFAWNVTYVAFTSDVHKHIELRFGRRLDAIAERVDGEVDSSWVGHERMALDEDE